MVKKTEARIEGETHRGAVSMTMRAGARHREHLREHEVRRERADAQRARDALAALERSEANFRRLIETSPEMIYVQREGRIVYVNEAAERCLGCARGELIGRQASELVHPDDRGLAREQEDGVAGGAPPRPARVMRLVRKDGSACIAENVAMLLEFDGAPATVVIGRDVTEREKLHQQLLRADRMASLGTLSAGVAHEINNPLTYVLVNVEHVMRRLRAISAADDDSLAADEIPTLLEALTQALDGASRVRHIVRDLMVFARGHVDAKGLVDVRKVMEASLQMTAHELRHRAKVERKLREVPPVEANEARLGHVFLSLLVNAAQAIPEGDAARNAVTVSTYASEDCRVVIEVRDTGGGIRPEDMGRIFDPFFTTQRAGSGAGAGLGLSVAHGTIEAFGGELTVESTVGSGTCVRVTLPAAPGYAELARRRSMSVPTSALVPRRRVLVIDDDSKVADAIALALRDEHDVEVSSDASSALTRFQKGTRFDVVLCDLMMPQMTGMDFYREVLRVAPQLASHIVFMSGGAFTPRARAFVEGIPNRCIEKPPEVHKLRELVRRRGT